MKNYDIIVIGAGFAGMYMLHRARQQGLDVRVFEAGSDVGGTWYWNRYPGARCDVESMEYSYQFDEDLQQEWEWSERYAPQAEILAYAGHVAERFNLREDIQFNTRVSAMAFDEESACWLVTTDEGESSRANFVVAATGCLSVPVIPEFPGRDRFKGDIYHTGSISKDAAENLSARTPGRRTAACSRSGMDGYEWILHRRRQDFSGPASREIDQLFA